MICKKCNNEVDGDFKFCPVCGAVYEEEPAETEAPDSAVEENVTKPEPKKPEKVVEYKKGYVSKLGVLVFFGVIVVFGLIALIVSCNSCNSSGAQAPASAPVTANSQVEKPTMPQKNDATQAAQTEAQTQDAQTTAASTAETQAPTEKIVEKSADNIYTNSKYSWTVTYPDEYADGIIAGENENGDTTFYVKSIKEASSNPGYGRLFVICAAKTDISGIYADAELLSNSGDNYFVAVYSSDAPYDAQDAEEYAKYKAIIPDMVSSFKAG